MAVTPAAIAAELGRPSPQPSSVQYKQWTLWIDGARRIIKARLGDLDLLDQGDLDYVVRSAVVARAQNPNGTVSETVSADDASLTKRYDRTGVALVISDQWWDLLTPNVSDPGAFTIRPYARHTHRGRC